MTCKHPRSELRRRTLANGAVLFKRQCLDCGGEASGAVAHNEVKDKENVPPYDFGLKERAQLAKEVERRLEEEAWWAWYNEYLLSARWREKRAMVLERDQYICQGCRSQKATVVHHLTYKHAGDELLFELTSVCGDCHQKAHPNER